MEEGWGFTEVVDYLGLSRQRVTKLVNREDFPAPVQTLASGRIWLAEAVKAWNQQRRERYPGLIDDET